MAATVKTRDASVFSAEIAAEEKVGASYVSATLPLAYLAPQIVEEILSGKRARDRLVRYPGRAHIDPSWRAQIASADSAG